MQQPQQLRRGDVQLYGIRSTMTISNISNGESLLSVRTKLNSAISKLNDMPLVSDFASVQAAISAALAGGFSVRVLENTIVRVPEDAPTLQNALDAIDRNTPIGVTVTVRISSGHNPAAGISLSNGDWSAFEITSVDATVSAAAAYSGILINGDNAKMPNMSFLFDALNRGLDGIKLTNNSHIFVSENCGVINSGGNGIVIQDNSSASAYRSKFDGADLSGISVQTVSSCFCDESSVQNCGLSGLLIGSSSTVRARNANFNGCAINGSALTIAAGIIADRSSALDARGATAQNSNYRGAWIDNGSIAVLRDVNVSGAVDSGFYLARGAYVSLHGATASNCGGLAIAASTNCQINANLFTATGYSGTGSHILIQTSEILLSNASLSCNVEIKNSRAIFDGAQISSATGTALSIDASFVSASDLQISSAGSVGVLVQSSDLNAPRLQVTNSSGYGIEAQAGSSVRAVNGNISGSGSDDVRVTTGSSAFLNGTSTTNGVGTPEINDVNLSSFNAIQGNFGIIWN